MAKHLVFDTEVQHLPLKGTPSDDPRQPHIVELAAILWDDEDDTTEEYCTLIKPDGWESSPEALAVHGITAERGYAEGIYEVDALDRFHGMRKQASIKVAHNIFFDNRIIRIAYKRFYSPEEADSWSASLGYCTCTKACPIVKLPPTERMLQYGFNKFKNPSLSECIKHFFDEELIDAHSALADCRATLRLYKELLRLERAHGGG